MEQIKEAVYLINDERYLHLRENSAGVGFATYNKVTGERWKVGRFRKRICRQMDKTPFLPPGTGICLNFRTMTARPSNRKA